MFGDKTKLSVFYLMIPCLLLLVFASFAGTLRDEFNDKKLNEDLWDLRKAAKASYKIEDGKITLDSPNVEDGIVLNYRENISDDIAFEFKMEVIGDSLQMGFWNQLIEPTVNTDVNAHWSMVQTITSSGTTYVKKINNEKVINDIPIEVGEGNSHIYRIEVSDKDIIFAFDEEEIGRVDKPDTSRYFMISPDPYTSHYGGRKAVIEYVQITGESVRSVITKGKIAVIWCKLKNEF